MIEKYVDCLIEQILCNTETLIKRGFQAKFGRAMTVEDAKESKSVYRVEDKYTIFSYKKIDFLLLCDPQHHVVHEDEATIMKSTLRYKFL